MSFVQYQRGRHIYLINSLPFEIIQNNDKKYILAVIFAGISIAFTIFNFIKPRT
ncbi:hypothetical protein HMPREF1569_2654 [Klebsiella oxytoca OK-1]|nr:hypothetical protein HMPREF1569_2654 [Klebsiella oxytoca OK-1]